MRTVECKQLLIKQERIVLHTFVNKININKKIPNGSRTGLHGTYTTHGNLNGNGVVQLANTCLK